MIERSRRRRRDRGFSLITVFMLMMVMTGTAIGVLVASQSDVNLAGVGREQQQALYAAEYAIARAKGLISSQTVQMYNSSSGGWNGLLQCPLPNVQAALCVPPGSPAHTIPLTVPTTAKQHLYWIKDAAGADTTSEVQYNFCVHNNADDPGYLETNPPVGDTNDAQDSQHLITLEGYGYAPNNATVHLSITVGPPTLNSTGGTSSYAQEGAGAVHTGAGGTSEVGVKVGSTASVKF